MRARKTRPHAFCDGLRLGARTAALIAGALIAVAASKPRAEPQTRVCTPAALAALKVIPQPPFPCQDGTQLCSSDKPLGADGDQCKSAVDTYEKTLAKLLTPRWWSAPPPTLEACRVRAQPGPLTREENDALEQGYGEQVQGTNRVRMLVVGGACGADGMSNIFLVVRTAAGIALTPLYFDFNQGGQEAPFHLDVVNDKSGTFALFTTQGHDMQSAYTTTAAYKVDARSGHASPYPLFYDAHGGRTILSQSEPVISGAELSGNEIVREGKFVKRFNKFQDNLCDPKNDKCPPVSIETYTWNGRAFLVSDYARRHEDFLRKLAAQRECVSRSFDPAKGTAACAVESECENYNDLARLNFKAGNFTNARNNAEMALQYCAGYPKEYQAAQYNYRQSARKLGAQ